MRLAAVVIAVVACASPAARRSAPPPPDPIVVPGLRLPDGATPLGYELRLEVDPDSDAFAGTVTIRVRLDRPRDHVWLHVDGLDLGAATWRQGGEVHALAIVGSGDTVRAFGFGTRVAGEVELAIAYTGRTGRDQEGLFRQQDRGRWYLFSQAESLFARRFVPCFDEPSFKVPWRVTVVGPGDLPAFANAPEESHRALPDGRRETRFAATPPLASYLLAIAVGPFEIVDAGHAGALPVRAIVLHGDAERAAITGKLVPTLVDKLEAYLDAPLPWPKLDLVAVPHFFGAMENPGLVTCDRDTLIGDAGAKPFADHFVRIVGHELAHMWLGDSVTPAWWDDLWLAEAFAQWLVDKLALEMHAFDDSELRLGLGRQKALAADDAVDARPLHHALAVAADVEAEFDAISYEKGAALIASFERVAGVAPFQAAVRAFVRDHAGRTATTADFIAALARATTPALARGLADDVERAGAPVVTLAVDCAAKKLIATATNGVAPMCFRSNSSHETCALVDGRTEVPLASCPPFVIGNAFGRGYYHVVEPDVPLVNRNGGEQLAYADDIVAALHRGELTAQQAADHLRELATAPFSVFAKLGALAIARALEPNADPRQLAHALGHLFHLNATDLFMAETPTGGELAEALLDQIELPPLDRGLATMLDRSLADPKAFVSTRLVRLAAPARGRKLFDQVLARATAMRGESREQLLLALGAFGPDVAPAAIDAVIHAEAPAALAVAYLTRPLTRVATWHAIHEHADAVLAAISPHEAQLVLRAAGGLCDAQLRAQVDDVFGPRTADIEDGKRTLTRTLAAIDRCIARRVQGGPVTL